MSPWVSLCLLESHGVSLSLMVSPLVSLSLLEAHYVSLSLIMSLSASCTEKKKCANLTQKVCQK